MGTIRSLEDFQAWQSARVLATEVYSLPRSHPAMRDYGYRDQLCRAAVSQMSNLAEAYGRTSPGDRRRFLGIARGSGYEVLSLFELGGDIGHFSSEERKHFVEMTRIPIAQTTKLMQYLKTAPPR